ncbi:CbrC family protein [Spongorhabdus nitratireducens]
MSLPKFKYHPDPLQTGSVIESEIECECCEKARGYIYTGPVYAEEELDDCICPWCIASGKAYEMFDAEFTDYDGIGNYGAWGDIPDSFKEIVARRTPGFLGWQQERWWAHCGEAAAYLGAAGKDEIEQYGARLKQQLQQETDFNDTQWAAYFENLSKDDSPTAYIFQCLHCGELGGYSDCH